MDTNKLTTKSRDAVSAALRNALTAGNPNAEPAHLLHALLMVPGNTAAPLIQAVGADPSRRRRGGAGRDRQAADRQGALRSASPRCPARWRGCSLMRRTAPSRWGTRTSPPSTC